MAISKRAGFACVAGACVALTGTAFGQGGDDPFTATEISALPFSASGSTVGLTDQFDVVCPFTGSTSPDAWYSYTTTSDVVLAADICESAYDTKLYVLDDGFSDIACNDDGCSDSNGNPFRSILETPTIEAGSTVFIVVDGWGGDLGDYNINVAGQEPPEPCELECDGIDEGEACDDTGGTDINGGCNSTPTPLFTNVECGATLCGIAWGANGTRDTDWFDLPAQDEETLVTYTITTEFEGVGFYLGANPDCDSVAVIEVVETGICETGELNVTVPAGANSWWFAGTAGFEGFECGVAAPAGNDYVVSIACTTDIPPAPCPDLGDSNGDGFVDFTDLLNVLNNFGECP